MIYTGMQLGDHWNAIRDALRRSMELPAGTIFTSGSDFRTSAKSLVPTISEEEYKAELTAKNVFTTVDIG